MTEKLQQTIKEEIAKLPKEGQDVVNAIDWVKIIEEIGRKYQLDEEKITYLQTETLLALIGSIYPEEYPENIEKEVGTTKEIAEEIATEAGQKIFTPIYKTLTEKIKSSLKTKKPNWKQSVEFILSGGDYTVFMDNPKENETTAR